MKKFELEIPDLRLGEFDLGGVLYHANYFHLYETAREAFLRQGGYPYSKIIENDSQIAIVESHQKFHRPVYFGRPISVRLSISELSKVSLVFDYEIEERQSEKNPVHEASTKCAHVTRVDDIYRVSPFPEQLRALFETLAR